MALPGKPYDLVVMDWQMPGMNGVETVRKLRALLPGDAMPTVIMVSAYTKRELVSQAEEAGVASFLFKPINRSVFFNTIVELFHDREPRAAGQALRGVDFKKLGGVGDGVRVLVVEDNRVNQQVARETLESWGLQVDVAPNGLRALEMAARARYHAILMDLQMPEMDGYEASRKLRERGDATPVIACTAHTLEGERQRCLQAGMNDFVSKPIDPEQLHSALRRWILPESSASSIAIDDAQAQVVTPTEVPGIDVAQGVRRVAGNAELHRELTQEFGKEFGSAAADIERLLAGARFEEAVRLAHTVKGVAGNLGANVLYAAAVELEKDMMIPGSEHDRALGEFKQALDLTMQGVVALAGGAAGADATCAAAEAADGETPIPALRILLAEDSKTMRRFFATAMERLGHEVATADNGREAYRMLYRQWSDPRPYDVLFLDIEMPVLDGLQTVRRIREYRSSSGKPKFDVNIPVVAVSAHTDAAMRESFLQAGMDYCLEKNAEGEALSRMLRKVYQERILPSRRERRVTSPEPPRVPAPGVPPEAAAPSSEAGDSPSGPGRQGAPETVGEARELFAPGARGVQVVNHTFTPPSSKSDREEEASREREMGPLVRELADMAGRNSFKALDCLDMLRAALGEGEQSGLLGEIEDRLDRFDFGAAVARITTLAARLGVDMDAT